MKSRMLMGLALVAGLICVPFVEMSAADDKIADIETIMKKNNGKKGNQKMVGEALKAKEVKWEDVAKLTKDYSKLAADLPKNKVDKGDKASWDKLSKSYADEAKKLDDAAGKKDLDAAKAAHAVLGKSCKACHDAHK